MTLSGRGLGCVAFVVLCMGALSFAEEPLPDAPHMGTLTGTVLDVNGGTVPNAKVLLQGSGGRDVRVLVTGEDGFFKFDGVNPGAANRLQVSASGFTKWSSNEIVLKPGQTLIVTGIILGVAPVETSVDAVVNGEEVAAEQVKLQEKQRVAGIVPNFYVTYDNNAAPLTPKLKFQLALRLLRDPATIAGVGLNAAIFQMADYPSYQQGAKGYAQRFGANFAGASTDILVGDALLPSLLHQDPRYFYQGTGTTKSRLLHALSTAFLTRGDDGRREINWSNIGGDLVHGAMANAYYPSQDRGPGLVVRSSLIGAASRTGMAVMQEFVLHKATSHSSDGR